MLELKKLTLNNERYVSLVYTVQHNTGSCSTVLEQDLELNLDTLTGRVTGAMHLTDLSVDSLEAAREKMAVWCDRLAAALRSATRKPGDIPIYERKPFDLASQPLWLQQEYNRLVDAHVNAKTEADQAAIEAWLAGHPMTLVRGMIESAECAAAKILDPTE